MAASARPNSTTRTGAAPRAAPASRRGPRGPSKASRITAAIASRSSAARAGPTAENRLFASAAPTCIEPIPPSTSKGAGTTRPGFPAADTSGQYSGPESGRAGPDSDPVPVPSPGPNAGARVPTVCRGANSDRRPESDSVPPESSAPRYQGLGCRLLFVEVPAGRSRLAPGGYRSTNGSGGAVSAVGGAAPTATPGFVDATEYFRDVRSLGSPSPRQRANLAARFVLDLDGGVLRARGGADPSPAGWLPDRGDRLRLGPPHPAAPRAAAA